MVQDLEVEPQHATYTTPGQFLETLNVVVVLDPPGLWESDKGLGLINTGTTT